MRLILASQSRFRAGLLAAAGVAVETMPAHVDEADVKQAARAEGASAEETALLLASLKAERIARQHPDALVIGGDQMLVCDGTWFDKPPDMVAARALRQGDHPHHPGCLPALPCRPPHRGAAGGDTHLPLARGRHGVLAWQLSQPHGARQRRRRAGLPHRHDHGRLRAGALRLQPLGELPLRDVLRHAPPRHRPRRDDGDAKGLHGQAGARPLGRPAPAAR